MKIIITKNYQEMSRQASRLVIEQLKKKKNSVLGLATGNTPLGMYKELVKAYRKGLVSFNSATSFNLDEFFGLGEKERGSLRGYMDKNFFSKINLQPAKINFLNGLSPDWRAECGGFEKKIKGAGGIDLQILGIGLDGHIGFAEPGTKFNSKTSRIKLKIISRKDQAENFAGIKKVPFYGLSMGIATIMSAKKIVLLADGEEKSQIVAKALEGRVDNKVPASVLQKHPNLIVILDKKAAADLKKLPKLAE